MQPKGCFILRIQLCVERLKDRDLHLGQVLYLKAGSDRGLTLQA
jgi:hypothetical protein